MYVQIDSRDTRTSDLGCWLGCRYVTVTLDVEPRLVFCWHVDDHVLYLVSVVDSDDVSVRTEWWVLTVDVRIRWKPWKRFPAITDRMLESQRWTSQYAWTVVRTNKMINWMIWFQSSRDETKGAKQRKKEREKESLVRDFRIGRWLAGQSGERD